MELTREQAKSVVWEDDPDWKILRETKTIHDEYKEMLSVSAVFEHQPSGKFYEISWTEGTHYNDSVDDDTMFDWGSETVDAIEVALTSVVREEWVAVQEENA